MTIQWREHPSTASLPWLLGQASRHYQVREEPLPNTGLYCRVTADAKKLQEYRSVCQLEHTDALPPLYPHILAFKLQMTLLTDKTFPFPLPGLVHLDNRIKVIRALDSLGPYTVSVTTKDLQPHGRGTAFTLVTYLEDRAGPVWEAHSRILCKKVRIPGKTPRQANPLPLPQHPLAAWSVPQHIGWRYARVSGDYNPIHLSAFSARLFGFNRPVAHGLWSKARCLAALAGHLPESGYEVSVRFKRPVPSPADVELLASPPGDQGQFTLCAQNGSQYLVGRWQLLPP